MRKIILLLNIILCWTMDAQSANPQISTDLPKVIPPSPTVSSLMKFEEIPVSNYTGIPDVSIPLISVPTSNGEINVSLNYHPSSIAVDEVASDVGLGWNLFSGGTVSRVVKGFADETLKDIYATQQEKRKVGIYHTNHNSFYDFSENVLNNNKTYYKSNLTTNERNVGNEFIWTASKANNYDTEHDLWQFNFLGNTGRFYIKKNLSTNKLEIVPLDNYTVKIINNYNVNNFEPTDFIIFDDKGYKYIFDVIESTKNFGATQTQTYIDGGSGSPVLVESENLYDDNDFNSSFHLSKILDPNNKEVVNIEYQDKLSSPSDFFLESYKSHNLVRNHFTTGSITDYYFQHNYCDDLPPVQTINNSFTNISVKKIKTININERAKIDFSYNQGRQDDNLGLKERAPYLKTITYKNWNGTQLKKYELFYDYFEIPKRRMYLNKITEYSTTNAKIGDYNFYYKNFVNTTGYEIGKDKWGFMNLLSCDIIHDIKNITPNVTDTNILQRIQYPLGGYALFEFESNDFSYIGDEQITASDENISYNFIGTTHLDFTPSNNSWHFPTSTKNRKVTFHPNIVDSQSQNIALNLIKLNGNNVVGISNISCLANQPNCCINIVLEKNTTYKLLWNDFNWPNASSTGYIDFDISEEAGNDKIMLGGGVRIKNIKYYDNTVTNLMFDSNQLPVPKKQKNFQYHLFGDSSYSSGSLSSPIPKFDYLTMFESKKRWGSYGTGAICSGVLNSLSDTYILLSNNSNYPYMKSKGGIVGYKNVMVSETDKGSTKYTYTSPIDFYTDFSTLNGPPFVKPKDFDYKRGLLLKEENLDNTNRILLEIINVYNYNDNDVYGGVKFIKPSSIYNGSSPDYARTYTGYISRLGTACMQCRSSYSSPISFWGGLPLDINTPKYIPVPIFETYGWAKLSSKQTKNYFYENGNQKVVETLENFTYNNLNKKISEHTVTHSDGNTTKTKYYYDTGNNSVYSQNRISEIKKIETFENNELINTKEIDYSNAWVGNASFLPQSIKDSHSGTALQTEVVFNHYDDKGNLVQYTTKEGIPVTIIWGYNGTQPIAKIEGAVYNNIKNNPLITAIINASNSDAANPATENNLIAALDALRKDINFKDFQMATYTYDPLIGVTSITPPSGIREIYKYDTANRLEKIVDINGKVLKEIKYNYKP